MKTSSLILALFIAILGHAQRIDLPLKASHPGAKISPIQLSYIDSNILAVVYVADSFNYVSKLDKNGNVLSTSKLDKISENRIVHVNFNKNGYDVFYQNPKWNSPARTLLRVNEKNGNSVLYVLSTEDSIYKHNFFAFTSSKFVWFNHYESGKAELVVGKLNDTGNAETKVYPLQSHYTELTALLGSNNSEFIAYFNSKRYLLSVHDNLEIDTVSLDDIYGRVLLFNNKLLHTVDYSKNQWIYTALLNSNNDTLYNEFRFGNLVEEDVFLPIGNKACIATRRSFDNEYDSLVVILIDTSFNEVLTRYLEGFNVTAIVGNADRNEVVLLGYDSLGLVLFKVNNTTFNTGLINERVLNINLHPNPAKDKMYINSSLSELHYQIYNASGQVIQTGKVDEFIDVQNIKTGLHFLLLTDSIGKATYWTKFVKE